MKTAILNLALKYLVVLTTWMYSLSCLQAQNNPPLSVQIYDSSACQGYIFTSPYIITPPFTYDHPQMILDRFGNVVWYRIFMNGSVVGTTADFKLQPNGQISFYVPTVGRFYLMDSMLMVEDSISAGNGYDTDTHELQILANGHYLVLGRETRTIDLSAYSWFGPNNNLPGSSTAQVTGSVVQELDANKNVIFEWKAHDHFAFADVDPVWMNSPSTVDWTHSNALEKDFDGNILLSSRHFNEITKIDFQTGNILWRFGGKNNQFTFVNDSLGFTGQHDIRRQADGHITFWDNGQFTTPPLGRALEFTIDENAKTAERVWEYIQDSAMFSFAMGNHQKLANNDRFLCFGFVAQPFPMLVHVKPDYSKVLEIYAPAGYGSYRSFSYENLPFTIPQPGVQCMNQGGTWYLVAEPGHPEYLWSNGATTQSIPITATGNYQVFTPYGGTGGHAGSEVIRVTNLADPCNTVGMNEENEVGGLALSCYPNPVEVSATIVYTAPQNREVTLILSDVTGRAETIFNAGHLSSEEHLFFLERGKRQGLYILKISDGNSEKHQKVIFN